MSARTGFDNVNSQPVIQITHLDHRFTLSKDGRRFQLKALQDISLEVPNGEFVSIVGPSGCGKTTLLNILAGLEALQSGTVLVGGNEPKAGRADIAYMFARDCLLPWRNTLENAAFGMELQGEPRSTRLAKARQLLAQLGLVGFEQAYTSQLSQGMRQRVALARTFALGGRYLLMDEPFAAVDAQTKLALEEQLLSLWESDPRRTVLFVTHDLGEAIVLSDRVVVFSRSPGRIKADIHIPIPRPRSAGELLKSKTYHSTYAEIWGHLADELANGKESEKAL